jgi:hypothetical protein
MEDPLSPGPLCTYSLSRKRQCQLHQQCLTCSTSQMPLVVCSRCAPLFSLHTVHKDYTIHSILTTLTTLHTTLHYTTLHTVLHYTLYCTLHTIHYTHKHTHTHTHTLNTPPPNTRTAVPSTAMLS